MKGVKGTCGEVTVADGVAAVCELLRSANAELTTREIVDGTRGTLTENQANISMRNAQRQGLIESRHLESHKLAWRMYGAPTTIKGRPSAYADPLSIQGHEAESGEPDIADGCSSMNALPYIPTRLKTPNALTPLQETTIATMLKLVLPCKVEHIGGACRLKVYQIQQAIKLLRERGMIDTTGSEGRSLLYVVTEAGRLAHAEQRKLIEPVQTAEPSAGHLAFYNGREYYDRGGAVYVKTIGGTGIHFCLRSNWPKFERALRGEARSEGDYEAHSH